MQELGCSYGAAGSAASDGLAATPAWVAPSAPSAELRRAAAPPSVDAWRAQRVARNGPVRAAAAVPAAPAAHDGAACRQVIRTCFPDADDDAAKADAADDPAGTASSSSQRGVLRRKTPSPGVAARTSALRAQLEVAFCDSDPQDKRARHAERAQLAEAAAARTATIVAVLAVLGVVGLTWAAFAYFEGGNERELAASAARAARAARD